LTASNKVLAIFEIERPTSDSFGARHIALGWLQGCRDRKSTRTLSGPRLRHVAYLGSFKEANLTQDKSRACFWQGARERLDQLGICGRITSRDREKIEAALAKRVPPITPEQEPACCLELDEESRQTKGNGSMSASP
jgi:hypothetical protein